MNVKVPSLATIIATLGGLAGITADICAFVGVTPSSNVGKIVEGAVGVGLTWIASHHASATVRAMSSAKAAAATFSPSAASSTASVSSAA